MKRVGGHLLDGPFYFICKHPVHRRDDLHWHVDEPLRKDQADVGVGGWRKGFLKESAKCEVRACLRKSIVDKGFD